MTEYKTFLPSSIGETESDESKNDADQDRKGSIQNSSPKSPDRKQNRGDKDTGN